MAGTSTEGFRVVPDHGICDVDTWFSSRKDEMKFVSSFVGGDPILAVDSIEFASRMGAQVKGFRC